MTDRRILVIEDDAAIREGIEDALRSEDYEVLSAADGLTGLHLGLLLSLPWFIELIGADSRPLQPLNGRLVLH